MPSGVFMPNSPQSDQHIVGSWVKNASPWITAIREGQIDSRVLCTNIAIVDAVLSCSPVTAIDLGCGEGWLTRKLSGHGVDMIGVDAIPELIEEAKLAGTEDFRVLSYEDIVAGKLKATVDTIVCNFSLLGKEPVQDVIKAARTMLNPSGSFLVQTSHPLFACGDAPYQDGWREGSWDGFADEFTDPAPWYFRTLESWVALFENSGYRLRELREPVHPKTGKPASVILIAELDS
jgi:2-polyprenyl-3-methyl-5-hydroxy-6-metoxy-1,4-benzoquinol methylase